MVVTNVQKSTVIKSTVPKSGADLTWDDSTPMTWNTVSGSWELPGLAISNVQKSTVIINNVPKSI